MKTIPGSILFYIFCFSFYILNSSAQTVPPILWEKTYGGSSNDEGFYGIRTGDNGFAITGRTMSDDGDATGNHMAGTQDYLLIKTDSSGMVQWHKCYGGTDFDGSYSVMQTPDGGYALTGFASSNNGDVTGAHGNNDFWVVKTDSAGTIQWQKALGGSNSDYSIQITGTYDGGYAVAGYTLTNNNGNVTGFHGVVDYWVTKLSSGGNLQWQKCYGGSFYDAGNFIVQTADSGFIVSGASGSNNGDVTGNHGINDIWVMKTNASSTLLWQKSFGGSMNEGNANLVPTADGGFILSGFTASNDGDVSGNHGMEDIWIAKVDSALNIEWQKCLGGSDVDFPGNIIQTNDGGFLLIGTTRSNDGDVSGNHGNEDVWVVKMNNAGTVLWKKCLGGSGVDQGKSVIQIPDGSYLLAGSTSSNDGDVSFNHGGYDYWVIRLGPDTITGIADYGFRNTNLKVFPNPFSDKIIIKTGFENGLNSLKLFDVFRREILFKPFQTSIKLHLMFLLFLPEFILWK